MELEGTMRRLMILCAAMLAGSAGCTSPKPGTDQRLTIRGEFIAGGLSASKAGGPTLQGRFLWNQVSASKGGLSLSGALQ